MRLFDLFQEVKDEKLEPEQLESYHKELSELRGMMKLELAIVMKQRAMFVLKNPELSATQRKINWQASPEGQREIELKAYISASSDNLSSLKARLFKIY